MQIRFSSVRVLIDAITFIVLVTAPMTASQGASLSGKVTRDNGDVMAGAAVIIEELRREARTDTKGDYRFDNVPPGVYHVNVRAEGYTTRNREITVTPQGATLDLVVELDLHFEEVVSVSPMARPLFESYQPTSVLAGQELQKEIDSTLAATLKAEPGIAMRALGAGPARPVIRGLDGDRVAILQDGQRTGDLSSQSGDHGVTINPASAKRVEVVRGPATLLYGSNAIGGLVNVLTDQIPMRPVTGSTGTVSLELGSNAREAAGAAEVQLGNGRLALTIGGNGRRTGNYRTPSADIDNSRLRQAGFNVGVARTTDTSYAGASYVLDATKYGIPFVEAGQTRLTPERHALTLRAGSNDRTGFITSYRATLGVKRYNHDELDGEEVATHFDNDTEEGEALITHRPFGRLKGTVGGSFLTRRFNIEGEEALAPRTKQRAAALFVYEEIGWPHVTVQFGARGDHTRFRPEGGLPSRSFAEFSGSAGLLVRPAAARDNFVLALNVARAARNPALEELYYFGPHPGNVAFEIGNPDLQSEHGLGIDLSLRARGRRLNGEVTFFRNRISDFIFRRPIDDETLRARTREFNARFGTSGEIDPEDFPVIEYVSADSVIQGIEAHADVEPLSGLLAEITYDFVRGAVSATDDPLPRMPPFRVIGGIRYQKNAFQIGGNVTHAGAQRRVFDIEEPTPGYTLLKIFGSYSFVAAGVTNTITGRVDNATDALYFNHLNYLKSVLPEMGRNIKLIYSVTF